MSVIFAIVVVAVVVVVVVVVVNLLQACSPLPANLPLPSE
jgi:hypothetical protein